MRAEARWNWLWRQTTRDAVYAAPLVPVPGTAGTPGRFIGQQAVVNANWRISPGLGLSAEYVHFFVGGALRRARGADVDFVQVSATYRF